MWDRPVRLPLLDDLGDRVERDGFLEAVFTTWYGYTPMGRIRMIRKYLEKNGN